MIDLVLTAAMTDMLQNYDFCCVTLVRVGRPPNGIEPYFSATGCYVVLSLQSFYMFSCICFNTEIMIETLCSYSLACLYTPT